MNAFDEDGISSIKILSDVCNNKVDSIMCNIKNYLMYLAKLTNDAFNECSIPFIAFGLRLILELTVLCVYIDLHHVYGKLPLQEKLSLSRNFNLSAIISRSTFFRRLFIDILGPKEGREMIYCMRSAYAKLSQFLHTPVSYCLTSSPLINPCSCIEELKELETLTSKINQIIRKLIDIWLALMQNFKQT